MKLTPKQVRFVYPFLPGIFSRVLRFTGKRNSVHLQETALVLEGELIRFGYIGLERLVTRALAEWSTVTIPYGRLVHVTYRSRWLVRALGLLALALGLFLPAAFYVAKSPIGETIPFLLLLSVLVLLLGWLLFRIVVPGFAVVFRTRDGTRTRFMVRVQNRKVHKEFAARLDEYRTAAAAFAADRTEAPR